MKNLKKRIAALTIASAMLSSFTACDDGLVSTKNEEEGYSLSGTIDSDKLGHYDIVEIKNDIFKCTDLYLARHKYEPWSAIDYWDLVGTNSTVANYISIEDTYISTYGEVIKVTPLNNYLSLYSEPKEQYSGEEIEEIFKNIKADYLTCELNNKNLAKKI